MKRNLHSVFLSLLTLISVSFFFFSCRKNHEGKKYTTYTYSISRPIYENRSTFLTHINGSADQPIKNAGKIYIKDNFIFLNEIDKGIHVIDNTNPSHPVQTAFLNIPGNQDIAVKGNILYADMYNDLLAVDVSDVKRVHVTKTLNNLVTERGQMDSYANDNNLVITGWINKDTTVTVEEYPDIAPCLQCYFDFSLVASSSTKSSAAGVAGSMARMVLINDYLYVITERHSLGVVKVSNAAEPSVVSNIFAGLDLETIYPFDGKLFLGSAIGLFMYDVKDPEHPLQLGQFSHGRACDPVIADGKYAYVTLHAGTACGGAENELNIINIEDLMNPSLVKSYPMTKPTGLSKDGNLLFICDDTHVKLYDDTDPSNIKLLAKIESNQPYDVIAGNKTALVVAKNGLYQYDYSNHNQVRQLSVIPVKN